MYSLKAYPIRTDIDNYGLLLIGSPFFIWRNGYKAVGCPLEAIGSPQSYFHGK